MRIAAIVVMVFNVGIVQAKDVDTARMIGTWSVSDVEPRESRNHGAPNVTAPMLISPDGYVRTRLTLSEIAFDSKHETAVLVFTAHCNGKCGIRGTVVYKLENGHWNRSKPILNFWIG
jgi:hypothetical protein